MPRKAMSISAGLALAMAVAGCGSPAPSASFPSGPAPSASPAPVATSAASSWVILGTTITGDSFSSPQALAKALSCPVTSAPSGWSIPSGATSGLFCTLNGNDPIIVAMYDSQSAEQQQAGDNMPLDNCTLVGPGWLVQDTQVNGTPPCDQAANIIGGTRADLLP